MHNASPVIPINNWQKCAKGVWYLIPRWPLRSIFTQFLEQLLRDLVSWGSPGKYSMIDCFLGDAWLQTQLKLMDSVVSDAPFLTGAMLECDIAHCRFVAVLCMLNKIRCNPMHPLYGALSGTYEPVQVTCCALVAHWYTYGLLTAEPCSIAGPSFS